MRFIHHARRLAVLAAVGLACLSASANAAEHGKWSIGGNFGVGTYSAGDANDYLESAGFEKISDGWEFGGTLRTALSPKASLELEGMSLNAKSSNTTGNTDYEAHIKGFALPLNLLYGLSQNDKNEFSLLVGAGAVLNMKGTSRATDPSETFEGETESKTAFMAQGGLEADHFFSPQFAVAARALGRYAKASNVAIDKNNPTFGNIDLDMSGFAFSLGLRMYFGGGGTP